MNVPTLIYRNLFRNKRRTLLMFLGLFISFFLFVSIFTLLEGFGRRLKTEAAQVNLFLRPVFMGTFIDGQIPEGYLYTLAKIPFIQYLTPYKIFLGSGRKEERGVFCVGVYPDQIAGLRDLHGVTVQQLDEFKRQKTAALVGQDVLEEQQWKVGDEINLSSLRGVGSVRLKIVGRMDRTSEVAGAVFVHYDYLKEIASDAGIFTLALFRVENPYQVRWASEVIAERFENAPVPVEAITEKGFIESAISELSGMAFAVKVIAWMTLIATLFVLSNTLAMSIRERTVDQGILRTMGFSKWKIFRLYLAESMILSILGGFLGAFTACAIFDRFQIYIPSTAPGRPSLWIPAYWESLWQVLWISILMGFLSGFPPAWFAMRRKITETLRTAV